LKRVLKYAFDFQIEGLMSQGFSYGNLKYSSGNEIAEQAEKRSQDIANGIASFIKGHENTSLKSNPQTLHSSPLIEPVLKRKNVSIWATDTSKGAISSNFRLPEHSQNIAGDIGFLGIQKVMEQDKHIMQTKLDFEVSKPQASVCFRQANFTQTALVQGNSQELSCFEKGPWLTLCAQYRSEGANIASILASVVGNDEKVPLMRVVIKKINQLEDGVMALLCDPTGEIQSEVMWSVYKSEDIDFVEGAAVALENFTVYRYHLNREGYASHSVIITPRNIKTVFPVNTSIPLLPKEIAEDHDEILHDWMDRNCDVASIKPAVVQSIQKNCETATSDTLMLTSSLIASQLSTNGKSLNHNDDQWLDDDEEVEDLF